MNKFTIILFVFLVGACNDNNKSEVDDSLYVTLSKETLKDKIKGAWAGQTIGVTYGFPVEFKFESVMVPDSYDLPWYDGYLLKTFNETPGVYDDVYMDLTFVEVLERNGLEASANDFANAFANSEFKLWFANQVARHNILNGIGPPASGYWLNNPAADDIDFQIEADFAGIMNPGMVNSASEISDRVGHIMNYGDGWYGGVYIAAMYSLAFVSNDIEYVVKEALNLIPKESQFNKIISELIAFHESHPEDWKNAWQYIHDNWTDTDKGPWGVFDPFNIDAKINAAWVVLGLLYGDGDFGKTIDIATRAGDDADCNPASAAGILGTMYGYEGIPEFWKLGLKEIEDLDFPFTNISLNDAYQLSYKHATKMIEKGGGSILNETVKIKIQNSKTVPLEISFADHYPKERIIIENNSINKDNNFSFSFNGNGFALMGKVAKNQNREYVYMAEMYIDGVLIETAKWPTEFTKRRFYLFWKYQLQPGNHFVEIRVLNPTEMADISLETLVLYDDKPLVN